MLPRLGAGQTIRENRVALRLAETNKLKKVIENRKHEKITNERD